MTKYTIGSKWNTRDGRVVTIDRHTDIDVVWGDDGMARWLDDGTCHRNPANEKRTGDLISPYVEPTPERLAIDLLKGLGYEVVEPKPKLSGTIQIIRSASGNVLSYPIEQKIAGSATILAIVSWTEGDGLDKSTEVSEPTKGSSEATEPDGTF